MQARHLRGDIRSRVELNPFAPAKYGSAHCIECKGPCKLTGSELLATQLLRMLFERYAMAGWRELPYYETSTLVDHDIDVLKLWQRAKDTTPRTNRKDTPCPRKQ
jgi:hypothetical protein